MNGHKLSFPFDVCDRMHTGQHLHNQFDASKKQYEPLLLTLIVQDIGTKKMKEKTKTLNLIVDHFYLTFHQFKCCTSMYDFRIREKSQFGVNTIIDLAYISLLVYLSQNTAKQLKHSILYFDRALNLYITCYALFGETEHTNKIE